MQKLVLAANQSAAKSRSAGAMFSNFIILRTLSYLDIFFKFCNFPKMIPRIFKIFIILISTKFYLFLTVMWSGNTLSMIKIIPFDF